jgi:regulator of RNase E activity RraA
MADQTPLHSSPLAVAGDEDTGRYEPADVRAPFARRLDRALLRRLAAVRGLTATASDVLDDLGCPLVVAGDILQPRLRAGATIAGQAVTLRYLPERRAVLLPETRLTTSRLAHEVAFEACKPGDVLVIDACGIEGVSTFGGMASSKGAAAGLSGIVVDGGIRDIDQINAVGLPAWSRSITPRTGKWRLEAVAVNAPICCGGEQVQAGDLVLADDSGVCFIPLDVAERAIPEIFAVAEREEKNLPKGVTAA